ncbi:hypothetical protein D9756_009221 [Leucocoprinus leucothites]|uniref:2-(3-amino-3-carboxypropyl)histidine synthase subunit 2 n=1 Tax=Leucocoprinus leucothites TaxID=201217 RepID=A0A8H5FV85_9AGAR|nr:hypothetical protein D9756_009221 [Leucoagaricus leucothites]
MSAEASSAFSTADESAITRTIDVSPDTTADRLSGEEFDEFYDIQRTVDEIIQGDFKRIALQFPDELLHDSVPIYRRLKSKIGPGRDLYVLADTSYGRHANYVDSSTLPIDMLTSRLPVIYVFGHKNLDIEQCVTKLAEAYRSQNSDHPSRTALLRHEVGYTHLADLILEKLRTAFEPLNITIQYTKPSLKSIPTPSTTPPLTEVIPNTEYNIILYIGGESLSLTNLLMTHAFCDVFSYNPSTGTSRLESSRTNKLLMRRYALVQKARDADVFGILVGTLGVASYLPLISHLRTLLTSHHKKSYTISVGKLTPSKLANFLEIECFILVACPEHSILSANAEKEFFKPIVTPFELSVALRSGGVEWTGRYELDFVRVIGEGDVTGEDVGAEREEGGEEGEEEDLDQPQFSLITGKYRHARRYGASQPQPNPISNDTSSLIARNQDSTVSRLENSAAAHFLQERSYKGLEARLGEDAPSVLEQGRSGVARSYQTDYGARDEGKD